MSSPLQNFSSNFGDTSSRAQRIRECIIDELERAARAEPPKGGFRQIIYLSSPPGYGKTTFIKNLVDQVNTTHDLLKNRVVLMETVLAAHVNPSDVLGTGFPITATMDEVFASQKASSNGWGVTGLGDEDLLPRHIVGTWTPVHRMLQKAATEGKVVLWFLDEFNNINSQWESAILKLSEGRLKDSILPDNFVLVGAGNPPSQSVHKSDFGESMKARLYMLSFIPDYAEWKQAMLNPKLNPIRLQMRQKVVDFIEINRGYFLDQAKDEDKNGEKRNRKNEKSSSAQIGYIATNPRNWTLTADALARFFRHHKSLPSSHEIQWLVERRIPSPIAREFVKFLPSDLSSIIHKESRSSLTFPFRSADKNPPSVTLPQILSEDELKQKDAPGDAPEKKPTSLLSGEETKCLRDGRDVRKKLQNLIQQTIERESRLLNDIRENDLIHDNLLAYLLDSLQEPYTFRPIPYLIGDPGLGKTSFVNSIIAEANAHVRALRETAGKTASSPNETSPNETASSNETSHLREFALVEVVLPSVPNISDLTGPVLPLVMDGDKERQAAFLDNSENSLEREKIRLRITSPGNDNLPPRHSVTTWTWFIRTIDRLAREGKQVVVFFDELSNISPEWEAAFLKMVEGKIGTWELPSSVVFLTAGNFAHQSTFGRKFSEPMQARLEFMHYRPHFGRWAEYMLRSDGPFEHYLGRLAVVEYLCAHPERFCSPPDSHLSRKDTLGDCPRRWTLAARWIGRMTHHFGEKLSPEQMVWFLSPCIGEKEATSFSAWLNRQSSSDFSRKYADLENKAKTLLKAYTLSAALSATSAGLTPSQSSPSESVRRKKTATQLQAEISMAKEKSFDVTNLSDAMPEQTINDIKQHSNTTDAVKAYLLEALELPPREGEFQDIIYLKSPPGYGKTSYIRGIIQEINQKLKSDRGLESDVFELVEITLSNFAPAEVTGLSFPEDNSKKKNLPATGANPEPLNNELSGGEGVRSPGNETLPRYNVVNTWTPITRQVHDILSRKRIPVIFIDEMSNITQQWEAIILKFAEAKIGSSWKIRGPLRFIAAGNPPSDSRAGREFSEPLKHRLYEIRYRPNFLDYERLADSVDNLVERFALQTVCKYLKLYPDHFVPRPGDLSYQNRSLCPRNWTLAASHYAKLLQRTATEMQLDLSKASEADLYTIRVPSEHLRYRLSPLLPREASEGFVAFTSLRGLVLGDEIICQGKSIQNQNLTLEQLRIVTRSVCVTIRQHVSELYPQFQRRQQIPLLGVISQMEMKKMQEEERKKQEEIKTKLRTYVSNFASFVQEVQKHPNCSVELDSLFMPSMEDLKPVMNMLIRDKKQIITSKEAGLLPTLEKLFHHIYKTVDPSSSPTSPPPPQTTKFLTTSNSSQPAAPSSSSNSSNPTSSPDMHANMHYRHRYSPGLQ